MPFPFQRDFQGEVWKMPFLATFFTFYIFFSEPDIKDETIKKYYINLFVLNIAYKRGKTTKYQSTKMNLYLRLLLTTKTDHFN